MQRIRTVDNQTSNQGFVSESGFSLIELLVVIAVISILVAILLPVMTQAKKSALKVTATSNMRQCYLALSIYAQDYDGSMPVRDAAVEILPRNIQCDPADYWRFQCEDDWPPMLGSFGYRIQDRVDVISWRVLTKESPIAAFIVTIFHSDVRVDPFKGDIPTSSGSGSFPMPTRVLALRGDGSVSFMRVKSPYEMPIMTWSSLFFGIDNAQRGN